MWDGFLGTRASVMFDFVALAMVGILPVLALSIALVKRGHYQWHKRLQLILAFTLLAAVTAFEIDVRLNNWRLRAEPSPYYQTWLFPLLYVHLTIAISTTLLWIVVTVQAWRKFPNPPAPGNHSRGHSRLAWPAAIGMGLTGVTGWIFYYLAFIAV